MSLDNVLLMMLDEPATGYDLKSEFEAGAITFWPATPSQIYSTLDRMDERGLLKSRLEASAKGPERRVYARTDRGTERMREWVRSEPVLGHERLAYIAQLSGIGLLDDPRVGVDFLVQLRHWFRGRLETLAGIEAALLRGREPIELDDASFFDWAALRMGITALDARVRCCSELLDLLEEREPDPSGRGPRSGVRKADA
ncbi:MAG: PadR family transcriptional regulator [Gemmatimonadota bacterium]|nr:PadR family transcriptional regulator [Gemmatimonadota bacterium]